MMEFWMFNLPFFYNMILVNNAFIPFLQLVGGVDHTQQAIALAKRPHIVVSIDDLAWLVSFSLERFPTKPWRVRWLNLHDFIISLFCDGAFQFVLKIGQWSTFVIKWWILFFMWLRGLAFCYYKLFEVLPINIRAFSEHSCTS